MPAPFVSLARITVEQVLRTVDDSVHLFCFWADDADCVWSVVLEYSDAGVSPFVDRAVLTVWAQEFYKEAWFVFLEGQLPCGGRGFIWAEIFAVKKTALVDC